ncbi:MAG: ATP-binding cassette domain-containing protein [Chitinivibrionales bacterium]|nr:ATP-binding cassette domain-containing protein [Chitinivibrionales bacterium]
MSTPLLYMKDIFRRFGAVHALKNVDLSVYKGEVHALVGENGAGKSTLMKILSGALIPDSGTIMLDNSPYAPDSPKKARTLGVAMIYQEPTLAPHLCVAANVTLGIEKHRLGVPVNQDRKVSETFALLGHSSLDITAPVSSLGIGEQQLVEIARALYSNARLIIMDEPTSSLSSSDTSMLFAVIRRLKLKGVTVIYISHFLEEVQEIADRYTVLRDGMSVAGEMVRESSTAAIIHAMVGRPLDDMFPTVAHEIGGPLASIENVSRHPAVAGTSLTIHKGEILGIAGLVGAGRTDLLRTVFGLDKADSGRIVFPDKTTLSLVQTSPRRSLQNGIDFLSENRKKEGLAVSLSLRDNITLSSLTRFVYKGIPGVIDLRREARVIDTYCRSLSVRAASKSQKVAELSGGNQQKAAFARILVDQSDILLLDEPTRGIDIGSKAEIYRLIGELASQGKAIIMVSSYLPELFGMCDTLAVMYRGTLGPARPCSEWNQEKVMTWATSGKESNS